MILRPAREKDSWLLWTWRNDPVTRVMFGAPDEVPWEEHHEWYGRSLANANRWILIGEEANHPVGVLRFDRIGNDVAKVSVTVTPENRGRGIGREILALGSDYAAHRLGFVRLEANIKAENVASLALFEGAGFVYAGSESGLGRYVLALPVMPRRTS